MYKWKHVLWTVWCIIGSFLTPQWLTLSFLNITGLIYQYDDTMDKGTAGVFGVVFLSVWVLAVLLPLVLFLREVKRHGRFKMIGMMIVFALPALLCMAVFNWNTVEFWIS